MSTTRLPTHPQLHNLELDNGVSARVLPHGWPEGQVELRLLVRAGSLQEEEDQQGIAHVLEHLAFRGTERYPDDDVVRHLAAYGSRFGPHLNATTSFETTTYKLQLPTTAIETGLAVMREWARGLTLDGGAIETERLVVLEEWRRGRGAQGRARDVLHPLFFGGSTYAERLPIGTETSLRTFQPEVVRRFYDDWYRPDLMALLVVGDVDAATTLHQIERAFSDIAVHPSPRPRTASDIPVPAAARAAVVTDPESVHTEVALLVQIPLTEGDTEEAYLSQHLLPGLVQRILQEQLYENSRLADPPFIQAQVTQSRVSPGLVHHGIGARVRKGEAQRGVAVLQAVVARLAAGEVDSGALERARARLIRDLEHLEVEAERVSSRRLVQELVRHHTVGEPMPGAAAERRISEELLQDITPESVAEACADWFPSSGRILTIMGPIDASLPAEDDVLSWLDAPLTASLETAAKPLPSSLVAARPEPGTVQDVQTWPALDLVRWTLGNGARVWLKATDFKADEVQVHLQVAGGHSTAEDEDLIAARTAVGIHSRSGVGDFEASTLARFLAGHTLGLRTIVNEHWHGLRGSSRPADLPTLFDLLWLRTTAPRFDLVAFENERASRMDTLANRKANPAALFRGRFKRRLWQEHPRVRPWKVKDLERMDLERSRAFFQRAMASLAGGDLILVGAIDPDALSPVICGSLGALPHFPETPSWIDRGRRAIEGPDRLDVAKGQTPRATVQIRYGEDYTDTPDTRYEIRALAGVLQLMLRAELRERRGGTYSVAVRPTTVQVPVEFWALTITFECDPDRVEELIDASLETVARLCAGDFPDHRVTEVGAQHARAREQRLRDNGFWLNSLALTLRREEDPMEILRHADRIASLDKDIIIATAKACLSSAPQLIGVLRPK